MLIIPAIDIMDEKCVRLTKGNFALKRIYSNDPIQIAKNFEQNGAQLLHVIDLDGAKNGKPENMDIILKMRRNIKIPIEVGGGIRNFDIAYKYLSSGINRIIIGTKAIEDLGLLKKLIKEFGNGKIIVSVDVENGKIASRGWQKTARISLKSFMSKLKSLGIREIIVTDVTRDGTLTTPNFLLFQKIKNAGFEIIAAGGISDINDLKKLKDMKIAGAILGKALYEGKISLPEALKLNNPCSDLTKRIIPCLDVKAGRVVKGINFKNLLDAGDPVELGKKYSTEGADELILLDISASKENRKTLVDLVQKVAKEVFIPFTVGGGIRTVGEIRALLNAGADKVSINTAAVYNPNLISKASRKFGSQCIVVAIDAKKTNKGYKVYIKGGSEKIDLDAIEWAKKVEQLGAGEILLTSMDADGTKKGFDLKLLRKISCAVNIPVIASGGAGSLKDFKEAFIKGKADAVLAASLFHYNVFSIKKVKEYLLSANIPVCL